MRRSAGHILIIAVWLGILAPAVRGDEAEDSYAVAAAHYSASRWELAEQTFQSFLARFPQHVRAEGATFYLGESQMQLARYPQARASFDALLQRFPNSPQALKAEFRRGEAAYLGGLTDEARRDLASFARNHPKDPLAAFALPYLGELALAEPTDPKAAEAYFTTALRDFPNGPLKLDCQLGRARALSLLGKGSEAEPMFRKLVQSAPGEIAENAQFELGLLYYRGGQFQQALEAWDASLKKFPNGKTGSLATLGRGWALYRLERWPQAEACFSSLLKDPKVKIEASYWLGLVFRARQDWRRAAETLQAAAGESHPLQAAIYFHAGDSWREAGDRERASQCFDRALAVSATGEWADDALLGKLQLARDAQRPDEVDRLARQFRQKFTDSPRLPDVYLIQAASLVELKRYEPALTPLRNYLEAAPEGAHRAAAYAELALCLAQLKRLAESRQAFAQLLAQSKEDSLVSRTTRQLADLAREAGDQAWSAELLERVASGGDPKSAARGLAELARTHLERGGEENWRQAAQLLDRLLDQYPRSDSAVDALLTRGDVCEKLREPERALTFYLRLIQEFPQHARVPEAGLRAAQVEEQMGKPAQAADRLRRLIREHPRFPQVDQAIYTLAWLDWNGDRRKEALAGFQRIVQEFPKSAYRADALYRLAEQAAQEEQFDRATALLKQLIASPADPPVLMHALYLQGRVASRRQRWEEVAPPLERLVEQFPDSPLRLSARYLIADALYRQQRLPEAKALLEKLCDEIQGKRDAWLGIIPLRRAQVLVAQSEWAAASDVARGIGTAFPDFDRQYEVDYVLGRCLAAQGEFDPARKAYRRVIESSTGGKSETAAMAQWMIGETYFHQGDFATAKNEYLKTEILYAFPHWQAAALLQAGKCHERLKQWQEASALYTSLLKKYPQAEFCEEARSRLQGLERRTSDSASADKKTKS